jgi:N12 class adenine-specific DNA methylase
MSAAEENALDRYIAMADEVIRDPERLDEWMTVFAPDAVVRIGLEPVRGHRAVVEFYRQFVAQFTESKHFWNSTVLADGTVRAEWVSASRMADGHVSVVAGVEHATVDRAGRILTLDNEFTVPPT